MFRKGKHIDTRQRFTIKKFKIGAASVLIGTVFAGFGTHVQANELTVAEPTVTTLASTEETTETGDAEPAAPVATEEAVVAEETVETDAVPTNDVAAETSEIDDTNAFVSEKATTKPELEVTKPVTTSTEATKPVTRGYKATNTIPTSTATERPANEGRSFTEGASFRADTTATPTVTDPMPSGYTVDTERLPEELQKFSDKSKDIVTFGIVQNDASNTYFSYILNKKTGIYEVVQFNPEGVELTRQTIPNNGTSTILYFDEGKTRLKAQFRAAEQGSSPLSLSLQTFETAEKAKEENNANPLQSLAGRFSDGYVDKSSGERRFGLIEYYAPLVAYSDTSHTNLLTGTEIHPDVIQSGYTGETYTTRPFNQAGEAGENFDVLAPLNADGVLTTAAWKEKGQVEDVIIEQPYSRWVNKQQEDGTFLQQQEDGTLLRKIRYEIVDDEGSMKISVFFAEKPDGYDVKNPENGPEPNFKPAIAIKRETRQSHTYTIGGREWSVSSYEVEKAEVIVKPSISETGPYTGPFKSEHYTVYEDYVTVNGHPPAEGRVYANNVLNIRNPFRRASDEIKYYYTQETAVVKFYDVTDGGKVDLNEDVTGINGKGESLIPSDQGANGTGQSVSAIIAEYQAKGYKVKVNGFDAKPTFNATTAEYPAYGTSVEDMKANEAARREANKATVEITLEKVKGSVVVNYVDENGMPLLSPNTVVDNQPIMNVVGDTATPNKYDTTPETIKHPTIQSEGKIYELVPTKSAVRTGEGQFAVENTPVDNETGDVAEETTYVNYVYKEKPKGEVEVRYTTEDGTEIKDPVVDEELGYKVGNKYDTEDNKPEEITKDGKTYVLVPERNPENASGTISEGKTVVTYIYKLKEEAPKTGKVVVNYVDEDGNVIKDPVVDTPTSPEGTDYDTTDNKPKEITDPKTNKEYVLVKVKEGSDSETGKVKEGDTNVTYVYKEKPKGEVEVRYTTEDGTEIKDPVVDEELGYKVGNKYDTEDNKPEEITKDGKTYVLVPERNPENASGTISEGKTVVTYIYKLKEEAPKQGDVVVKYVKEGTTEEIANPVADENNKPYETAYNTSDNRPNEIVGKDGKTYVFVKRSGDSAPEEGTITEPLTTVVYEYKEKAKGNVVVNYRIQGDENTPIQPSVNDTTDAYVGTDYNTSEHKTPTIQYNGKTYELVPDQQTPNETGQVTEGTTNVTYYYREVPPTPKQQSVIIFEDGTNKTAEGKNTELTRTNVVEGEAGTPISPNTPSTVANSTEATIKYYEERGYKVTTNGFDSTPIYDNVEGNVQEVKIVLEHQEIPVTPDKPKTPTDPLYPNPDEPNSPIPDTPNYPPGVSEADLNKTVTRTVYYWIEKENGERAFEPVTETVTFKRTAYLDSVTGEVKRYSDWSVGKFTEVRSPEKDGYTVDRPLVGEKSFLSQDEITALPNGKEFVEHVIYTPIPEAPKTGTVVIEYVDTKGNPIKTSVVDDKDVPVGTDYDTTDEDGKPSTITVGKDKYVLVPSLTQGTENGKVVEGTTTITYVYQKVANWIPELPAVPDKDRPRTPYPFNPEEPKNPIPGIPTNPETGIPVIPHVDGYVPNVPGTTDPLQPVDPEDPSKGYIPPSPENVEEDTRIPYTPVKRGTVIVHYEDTAGNVLKTPVTDENNVPVGTDYNTTDEGDKPTKLTHDGENYVLVPSKTRGTEEGKVVEGTTEITYVYQKVANWIPLIPGEPNPPKTPYPFDPTKPEDPIPTDPKVPGVPVIPYVPGYEPEIPLTPVDPEDPTKGYIPPTPETPGKDTPIPYVPAKGTVIVKYRDVDGNPLKDPVTDEDNVPVGTKYTTKDEGDKPTTLVHDGENYVLVPELTEGTEEGKVTKGTTTITYVYQKVANWIPLIPGEPNPPKTPYPFNPEKPNDPIPAIPEVPGKPGVPVIPYVPGYEPEIPLQPVDPEDPSKGYIPPVPETPGKDTPIPYVPAKGTVIVKYRDVDGNPLKDPVTDEDNVPVGTDYTTKDEGDMPTTLVHDGENYVLVPELTEGTEEGKVTKGTTTITYVYQKVANWIPLIPGEPNPPKTPYPFNPEKPNDPIPAIPEVPGKPGVPVIPYVPGYEPEIPLQPVDPEDPSKGYIPPVPETPGKDTPIPYKPANGTVVIEYKDVDGNVIKTPVRDEDNVPVGTEYNTTDEGDKPTTIVHDGETYVLVPSLTEGTEDGKVTKGTTTITYVYQKVANWIPELPAVPDKDRPRTPYPFNPEKPNDPIPAIPEVPGKPGVPVIPHVPGYEPVDPSNPTDPLKPVDPKDPNKGYIPPVPETPGKDTRIPYVPAYGTVVIEYKDVNGNSIKTPVTDENNVRVDTPYNTTDEGDKPTTIITEDGTRYVLVPSLTEGTEEGKVTKGTTTITYVYQKVANWIPLIPGNPNPPKTPYPFNPEKPNDPIPAVPEVPGKPGVPVIPFVPGYEPFDPTDPTKPLQPVDPEDPSKGYIPPVPTTPGEDTLIPYKPVPPTTPNIPGVEIPEQPTDPGKPTPPAEPGKPTPPAEPGKPVEPGQPTPPAEPGKPTPPAEPGKPAEPTTMTELPKTGDAGSVAASAFGIGTLLASLGLVAPRRKKD